MGTSSAAEDGVLICQLFGELELANSAALVHELERIERRGRPILIDLSRLEFIDSTGIAVLSEALRRAESDNREVHFRRGPKAVERIFELTGLSRLLPFVD